MFCVLINWRGWICPPCVWPSMVLCAMLIGVMMLLAGIIALEYTFVRNTSTTAGHNVVGQCASKTGSTCRVQHCHAYRNAVCRDGECICPENTCSVWSSRYSSRVCSPVIETMAWVHPLADQFPENAIPSVQQKLSTGIAFSGGGNRAYIASAGVTMAFNQLGLTDKIKYISGVSGGSWFTGVFTYGRVGNYPIPLPPVVPPSLLTAQRISSVGRHSILYPPTQPFFQPLLGRLATPSRRGHINEGWTRVVREIYYTPFGAGQETFFTYDGETEAKARYANPAYFADQPAFLSVNTPMRPYPIIVAGDIGPINTIKSRNSVTVNLVETTPLYTGEPGTYNVDYTSFQSLARGGYIESYAFGTAQFITNLQQSGSGNYGPVRVVAPAHPYAIWKASAASSSFGGLPYAPLNNGKQTEQTQYDIENSEQRASTKAVRNSGYHSSEIFVREFIGSPIFGDQTLDLFDDGGTVEFVPLISHVIRNVQNIFIGDWSSIPVSNANPSDKAFCEITPYFGVMEGRCLKYSGSPNSEPEKGLEGDYTNNQIFSDYELQPLLDKLWAAAKAGQPVIVSTTLMTVANQRYGIPAGQMHNIVWAFLGASKSFENALPEDVQDHMRGKTWGSFDNFPLYKTTGQNPNVISDIDYTSQQVNLLAQEMAYQVLQFDYYTGIISKWFGGDYYQAKAEYGSYGFNDYGGYNADYTPSAYKAGPAVAAFAADGALSRPAANVYANSPSKASVASTAVEHKEGAHHAVALLASIGLIVAGILVVVGTSAIVVYRRTSERSLSFRDEEQPGVVDNVALVVHL